MGNSNPYTLIEEAKWYKVLELCQRKPDSIKKANVNNGNRYPYEPLHLACMHGAPHYVIEELIKVAPHVTGLRDKSQNLPLHYACWNGASYETIRAIIDSCPASAKSMSATGNTPLHCACIGNGVTPKTLGFIIRAFPGALTVQNRNFKTPLHVVQTKQHYFVHKDAYLKMLDKTVEYYVEQNIIFDRVQAKIQYSQDVILAVSVPSSSCDQNINGTNVSQVATKIEGKPSRARNIEINKAK